MSDASVEPGSDRRGSLTEGELMQVGALLRGGLSSILCTRSMQQATLLSLPVCFGCVIIGTSSILR